MFRDLFNRLKSVTRGLHASLIRRRDEKGTVLPESLSRKKPYIAPAMRKLDPETAKLILLPRVWEGDESAWYLLDLLFPQLPKQDAPTDADRPVPAFRSPDESSLP